MEFKGKIKSMSRNMLNGEIEIVLTSEKNILADIEKVKDKDLNVRITKHYNKRSLDANAYCWVLISEIADKMTISKDECYLRMLKDYGQQFVCKIPNKYVEHFKRNEKYFEDHESLEPEEKAQYFRVFVGSSNYDTEEMRVFIEGIKQEAEALGIDTRTPNEIAEMLAVWGENDK